MGLPAKNVVFIVSFLSLPNIDEVKLKDQNKPNNTRNNKKQTKQMKNPKLQTTVLFLSKLRTMEEMKIQS